MENLFEALKIFMKYNINNHNPFNCEHDVLYIWGVDPSEVSDEDKKRLDELGFFEDDDLEGFSSFRYGSC